MFKNKICTNEIYYISDRLNTVGQIEKQTYLYIYDYNNEYYITESQHKTISNDNGIFKFDCVLIPKHEKITYTYKSIYPHINLQKLQFDILNYIHKLDKNYIKFIYGGITIRSLEERKNEHISKKQPKGCNGTWFIQKITEIKITKKTRPEDYKDLISYLENFLIYQLDLNFGMKCKNDRKEDKTISQLGGAGVNDDDLTTGKIEQFYIFYKTNNI